MSEREQAEQLDRALARRRAGGQSAEDEPELSAELRELAALAGRLERELPPELPDPAFRLRLRQELLGEPIITPLPRHWYQDWRVAVIAAAVALLLVGGVVVEALNHGGAETPARATVASAFQPAKGNATEQAKGTQVVANTQVLPPIDAGHVVQVPLGLGAGGGPAVAAATPEPTVPALAYSGTLPELPGTARSWLLSAPPSASTFVQNELARIGVTGTVKEETQNGAAVVLGLDETGFPVIRWRPADAFFSFDRGPNMPTPPPARADTDPKQTATDWLEEIGFDLNTIHYRANLRADSTAQLRVVEFRPLDLPPGAIDPGLGVIVGVRPDGSISYAYGFWLSLVEAAEVPLRPVTQAWQAAQRGEGLIPSFGPPPRYKAIAVKSVQLAYLLTRADESSYVLEPVAAFTGEVEGTSEAGQVTIYVAAVKPPEPATPQP